MLLQHVYKTVTKQSKGGGQLAVGAHMAESAQPHNHQCHCSKPAPAHGGVPHSSPPQEYTRYKYNQQGLPSVHEHPSQQPAPTLPQLLLMHPTRPTSTPLLSNNLSFVPMHPLLAESTTFDSCVRIWQWSEQ